MTYKRNEIIKSYRKLRKETLELIEKQIKDKKLGNSIIFKEDDQFVDYNYNMICKLENHEVWFDDEDFGSYPLELLEFGDLIQILSILEKY